MKLEPLQALYDYLLGNTRQDDTSANASITPCDEWDDPSANVSGTPCYEWAEYVPLPVEVREHRDNAAAE